MIAPGAYLTGVGTERFELLVRDAIKRSQSNALFAGCAYVSVHGTDFLRGLVKSTTIERITLIADGRDKITHPSALRVALDEGWPTRLVRRANTFHPKFLIGSRRHVSALPRDPRMLMCGSNNLSKGGLDRNVEAGISIVSAVEIPGAADLARRAWALGEKLTRSSLRRYELEFEEANKRRSPDDLRALGVSEDGGAGTTSSSSAPKYKPSFSPGAASVVWVGLESQTGGYAFQPEIPKLAAEALVGMIGHQAPVTFKARDESRQVRDVLLNYYPTAMHRLNVPNDVPGVAEARANKTGVVIVEKTPGARPRLRLAVTSDKSRISYLESKSRALGTFGDTGTRHYGWY